jgi:anti-sigma regulatory factor (Ser/Thr protein kinase)
LDSDNSPLAETTVVIAAKPDLLGQLHQTIEQFFAKLATTAEHPSSDGWLLEFTTAVIEVSNNVVLHAYPPATPNSKLSLTIRSFRDRAEATVTDAGVEFTGSLDPSTASVQDPFALSEGGFGLALVRKCVDQVIYRRLTTGHNFWQLVKLY